MLLRKWFDVCSATLLGAALAAACTVEPDHLDEAVDTTMAPLLAADASKTIRDQYIVVFHGDIGAQGVESAMASIALKSSHSRIEHVFTVVPGFAARLSAEDLAAIRRNPAVAYVEHDQEVRIEPAVREQPEGVLASRPDFELETIYPLPAGQPDGIDRVDQPSLPRDSQYNDHGCDGAGVLAYVIDTGVRATHNELTGSVDTTRGFTAIADGLGTNDCQGQGTFLASIIAGTQFGLAKSATVVPVRVLSCLGTGTIAGIISGVNHVATDCGPGDLCVASTAFGGGSSAALNTAVNNLVASGVPVTLPIGSTGCSGSPAGALSAIGVAGINDVDCPMSAASGSCIDIYGPGQTILGAWATSDSATQTLTSTGAAAAHVAGALVQGLGCGFTSPITTPAVCASPAGVKPLVFNDY